MVESIRDSSQGQSGKEYEMRHVESNTQIACVRWFRYQYPKLRKLLFAVPNGGARDRVTGAILKAEGVVAGVADLLLLVPSGPYHGLCIEMKTKEGRQSDSQKEWEQAVTAQGYAYSLVRTFADFKGTIETYLA